MKFSGCCAPGQDRAAAAAPWFEHRSSREVLNEVILGVSDNILADYPFTPGEVTDGGEPGGTQSPMGLINQIVPYSEGTRRIAIYSDPAGAYIGSFAMSSNKPTVAMVTPTITALAGTGLTTLSWTEADADNDTLTCRLAQRRPVPRGLRRLPVAIGPTPLPPSEPPTRPARRQALESSRFSVRMAGTETYRCSWDNGIFAPGLAKLAWIPTGIS